MKKVEVTIAFEDKKLEALEFYLKKENSTVQKRMTEQLGQLYEKSVPEPVREYLDSAVTPARPRRPANQARPRTEPSSAAPAPALQVEEDGV